MFRFYRNAGFSHPDRVGIQKDSAAEIEKMKGDGRGSNYKEKQRWASAKNHKTKSFHWG